ncbi:sensor histidine kinase [Leucobacter insecticola]|uniref:Sensor histidine kinase n=1 Tax=Leucobacter insecticola TaxID=2714934 RepID=A0A6G8FGV8_9MICO|nr:histidine kinase [Leucobacter insecticola]QIM15700.1 sensor histidine kinase [Leucobacter insecticola]
MTSSTPDAALGTRVEEPARPTAARRWPTRWWDLAVGGGLAAMLVPGGLGAVEWGRDGTLWGMSLVALAITMIGLFALLYMLLGRGVLRRAVLGQSGFNESPPMRRDVLFVVAWVLLQGVATAVNPSFATLQFLSYPMLWSVLQRYRDSVLGSGCLALLVGLGSGVSYVRLGIPEPWLVAALVGAGSFGFAVAMGTWITRIYDRGEAQRQLVQQLQATQHEVAVLSAESGAAAERERLSRELHDTLMQSLTGLVMLSEQAERALAAGKPEMVQDRLARVHAAALDSLTEARALIAHTQPLGDGGLEVTLARVVERLRADTGLDVDLAVGSFSLDRERQVVLLRATQEGLANVRKHARASEVWVSLAEDAGDSVAVLRILDNGVGPGDLGRSGSSGFGLSGLSDRVRAVGGTVSFGSGASGGALLEVRLPLARAKTHSVGGPIHKQEGQL